MQGWLYGKRLIHLTANISANKINVKLAFLRENTIKAPKI